MMTTDTLEGNTLSVYAYIVRAGEPVGTRDVTRGADLSSTSVAHHHLQKLENLDLIEKDSYGRYILKTKASIDGHIWIGNNFLPRLMFYSFFFMGALAVEMGIILLSLFVKPLVIAPSFYFLTGITLIAMLLFIIEGLVLYRKFSPKRVDDK